MERVVVGSAKYFIIDNAADINPPTIIPAKIKVSDLPFLNCLDKISVIKTVTTPKQKERRLIIAAEKPNKIATAAPTAEPELTPRRSGETSLF